MHDVEYLILLDDRKTSCTTVEALLHLLQSDSDIVVDSGTGKIVYKLKNEFSYNIVKGESDNPDDPKAKNIYFHTKITCAKTGDLQAFSLLLRSIRRVVASLLATPSAHQVLWDDVSIYYAAKAYPHISSTENKMRKLITKFMHINLGIAWLESRIPDDVQKSINTSNRDTTYLYNVDFIKLKDILLSESYSKDRDALINELKDNHKDTFKREEIEALIPMSNWDKYFSHEVSFDASELSKLWTQLYELRCKVAHNKSFGLEDLNETKKLCKKIDPVLSEAIEKLDHIHVDGKETRDKIIDEAVANASKNDGNALKEFLKSTRKLSNLTYNLTSPLQSTSKGERDFLRDVSLMKGAGYISAQDVDFIKEVYDMRNLLVHNLNDSRDIDGLIDINIDLNTLISKLSTILKSIDTSI